MRTAVLCVGLLLAPAALFSQKVPKRPVLADGDTNDARAYFRLGEALLRRDPSEAAAAFYWATRINPEFAEAHYGRWAAVLMSDPRQLMWYYRGDKRTLQSAAMQRNDSSLSRALQLNPMLVRRYERDLIFADIKAIIESGGHRLTAEDDYEINVWLDQYMRTNTEGEYLRAQVLEAQGNSAEALMHYGRAVVRAKRKAEIRSARGRLFLRTGEPDSAVAEFTLALEELRKRDAKDFVVFYNSKANLELMVGIAHERRSDDAAARAAYGRALAEDLAYYPAHVALGYLALGVQDSTTALAELDLAVQLRGDDPFLLQRYGFALMLAGRHNEAREQFEKAIRAEPYFALPRRNLGEAHEKLGNRDAALNAYRSFLATASRFDPTRETVEGRVKALSDP